MPKDENAPPLPWILSPKGVVEVYANNTHITWTKDDLRVRLAQIVEHPGAPNPGQNFRAANEERAAVTFTWRGAKVLRDELTKLIDAYESVNGEITLDITLPKPPKMAPGADRTP